MKRLLTAAFVCLMALLPFSALRAQSVDCLQAIKDASGTLDQARAAIESGSAATAVALINAAQTLMSLCELNAADTVPATPAPVDAAPPATATPLPPTPVVENTPVPSPTETATLTPEPASETAGHTLTQPTIDPTQGIAFVRFANTSADVGKIDIFLESMGNTPLVAGLAYGEITDFVLMNTDQQTFIIRSELGAELLTKRQSFTTNSSLVMLAIGLQGDGSFRFEPISIVRSEYNDSARVRIVNLVPTARLGITATNGTSFGRGLTYIGTQETFPAPGTYDVQIMTADNNPFSDVMTLEFEANISYTILIISGSDAGVPARLVMMQSTPDVTRVRFVSQRADSVALYYRPGNTLLLDNFAPGSTTDYFTLPSRSTAFIAYAAGTGPGGREQASISAHLRPGRDVTIALNAAGRMEVLEEVLTPLNAAP